MGEINSDDHYIYYCGEESFGRNGVAIIVNKRAQNAVLGCKFKNDRMISIRFQGKPFNITVIQVYVLTSNAKEAEVEWSYEDLLLQLLSCFSRVRPHSSPLAPPSLGFSRQEHWSWLPETPGVTGKFGLEVQNEAGQRLIEFCQVNTLVIANTLFQEHKRRLYTWTSPNGQH